MGKSIDISQLKTGSSSTQDRPSNPSNTGKNIDGMEVRHFDNGLTEMDPSEMGFKPEKVERLPNDKDRALQAFDAQMKARREEAERYNELLDQYGGQISEEELREELGKSHITEILKDGRGGEFEDNKGEDVDVSSIVHQKDNKDTETEVQSQESKELDELERELEMEDEMSSIGGYQSQTEQFVDPNLARMKSKPETEQVVEQKQQDVDIATSTQKDKTEYNSYKQEPVLKDVPDSSDVRASESVSSGVKPIDIPKTQSSDMSEEDKDLKALDDDSDDAPTEDFDEKLKAELSKKMRPVSKKFDLSNAVVSQTPVTVTNALADIIPLERKIFTWGLYKSKRKVVVKAFTATELNSLSSYMENAARSRDVFKALWDHIVVGKGKDFDSWLKSTSYSDVDNLWFAVYGACFSDTNYLPYTCPKCKEITVSADIPLESMCKFASDEIKAEFNNIINSSDGEAVSKSVFAEYRVQVSDSFVVGLREPSIYDAVIVPNLLDADFRTKYRDIVGLNAYISNIYKIKDTGATIELHPIAVKQFLNNEVKTVKARIIQYAKIIRHLTSDQYNIIMGHINSLNDEDTVYYRLPSISCDHCKSEIPEEREAAADLVFMRHRLAILGV